MLFDRKMHEELTRTAWDEARVRSAICEIAAETEDAFDRSDLWPVHPRDEAYVGIDVYSTHGLWSGAAGVLWGLHRLSEVGAIQLTQDFSDAAAHLHADYVGNAGGETPAVPGLWAGEAGILLVAHLLAPDSARTERLLECVRENADNATLELMWGSPGTMLAACEMLKRTGDERWRDAWCESADRLWAEWTWNEEVECFLWTQQLYGNVVSYLGPAHGFAGNVAALFQLLPNERRHELSERVAATVKRCAFRENALANWGPRADTGLANRDGEIRVQWCHGAPGIIASLASVSDDAELDELLSAGGELIWAAGPLVKGPGLCHGTAGNGYAFLALHRRSGESLWLERARGFAMHALEQVESERAAHGRGRYSLFTGDIGAALYAWQCIDGDPAFPTVDRW